MSFFFAYPALLWGLLAGGIPLLLHLLRRRRARLQELPTVRFLAEAHRQRKIDIRLQDLWLLLLRTLLILLLVSALAGPKVVLSGRGRDLLGWLGQGDVRRVLLVDTSRSMGYREAGGTRLEGALRSAEALLDELPASVEALVVGFSDGTPEEERALRVSFSDDRGAWKRSLGLLEPVDRPSRASWGLRRAAQLLAGAADGGVFLLTDLQRSAWEDLLAEQVQPGEFPFPISVVDVSGGLARNVWLQDVSLPALPVGRGEKAQVEVEIASAGYPGGTDLPLRLSFTEEGAEETREPMAERDLLLRAGERVTLALPISPSRPGPLRALLEVRSLEHEDPLAADNVARVECPVLGSVDVGVWIEEAPPGSNVGTFDPEEARFLRSCFRLGLETPGTDDAPPFIQVHDGDSASQGALGPDSSRVVILYGPPALSPERLSRLGRLVREGGAALVFIDANWPVPARKSPGRLEWLEELGFTFAPLKPERTAGTLRLRAVDHPAFRLLTPRGRRLFDGIQVWRSVAIQHPQQEVLAEVRIASGTSEVRVAPVLGEVALDSGRLLVCGVPLERGGSDLATSAAWVPVLQQLIKYLAASPAQLPASPVASLHPEESDLTRLSAAERRRLEETFPVAFGSAERLSEAIARGQGSRDLTAAFLALTVLLGLVEVFVSNRMR